MKVTETKLPGVLIIEAQAFTDDRGFFIETYNEPRYKEAGIMGDFIQDNLSQSKKGVLRGLHYQAPPFAQGKLVSVPQGKVLDVAVDIRHGSPTFGEHVAVELSADNKKQLWIPEGFAHGFLTLEDDTLFTYKCTNVYAPECDRGLKWNDPALGISWPDLNMEYIISEKDQNLPLLEEATNDFLYS